MIVGAGQCTSGALGPTWNAECQWSATSALDSSTVTANVLSSISRAADSVVFECDIRLGDPVESVAQAMRWASGDRPKSIWDVHGLLVAATRGSSQKLTPLTLMANIRP